MKYQKELDFLNASVKSAYTAVSGQKLEIEDKGCFDRVTNIDYGMERLIVGDIEAEFPKDGILSEEFNPNAPLSGRTWVVDPIDGTVNMSHNLALYGVQAALALDGTPVMSLIYLPELGETYYAVEGEGAFLNGNRIHAAKRPLNECIISIGDYVHKRREDFELQTAFVDKIYNRVSKMRLFGAASVDFAFLAAGRTDAFLMFTRNPWDILPGWLLCREAGCKSFNAEGGEYSFFDRGILTTANAEIAQYLSVAAAGVKV